DLRDERRRSIGVLVVVLSEPAKRREVALRRTEEAEIPDVADATNQVRQLPDADHHRRQQQADAELLHGQRALPDEVADRVPRGVLQEHGALAASLRNSADQSSSV